MRININHTYGQAAGSVLGKSAQKPLETKSSAPHLDKIELSHKDVLPAREPSLMDKKNEIVAELNAETSAARLDALKERVQNGLYHVASEDIASAIMGTLNKLA